MRYTATYHPREQCHSPNGYLLRRTGPGSYAGQICSDPGIPADWLQGTASETVCPRTPVVAPGWTIAVSRLTPLGGTLLDFGLNHNVPAETS